MITIAKEVYDGSDLVGVIAVDLTISQIEETILNIQFLETGYAFLINENGLTIAHQDQDLDDLELGDDLTTNIQTLESFETNVYTALLTNENGFETFEKTELGETITMYMAYSKIENTEYIVATVVPEEEAVASVADLASAIAKASRNVNTTLIIIIAIAAAISVGIGTLIAGQITKPVAVLTQSIKKLTKQDALLSIMNSDEDILIDSKLEAQNDEIGDLTRAFKGMLNSIKKDQSEKDQ
jgi:methyl-accepting chemotaxis protein